MFNPFDKRNNPREEVNNLYSVYDIEGTRVMSGVSMLEFTLFIEGMSLEEAGKYKLVPVPRGKP